MFNTRKVVSTEYITRYNKMNKEYEVYSVVTYSDGHKIENYVASMYEMHAANNLATMLSYGALAL